MELFSVTREGEKSERRRREEGRMGKRVEREHTSPHNENLCGERER